MMCDTAFIAIVLRGWGQGRGRASIYGHSFPEKGFHVLETNSVISLTGV